MSMVLEFLGLSPAGLNGIPAEDPAKDDAARRCGELVMDLVRRRRPAVARSSPRASIDNAIASVAATGGSTNGVLHLLAIAHEFGIPLDIDEFGTIADRTPIVADMQPGGRYTASDLYDAGGVALVMRELLKRDLLDGTAPNVDGRTIAEIAADATETDGPGRSSSRSRRRSSRPAASRSCAARSRRTAASSSWPATSGGSTAARPGSSTPRASATRRSGTSGSCRATSSSSATRARSAARACRRC